jgi:CRISPR/Cas system-associated endoribonuclease Cas2
VKLVTVTRKDLTAGYQLVQSGHSIAEFIQHFPDKFAEWKQQSNYLISLSTDNEERLQRLFYKLQDNGADVVAFYEPDIDNQMTAICYYGTPEMRKHTDKLDLALEEVKVATKF